jgi:hypothetical protein
MRIVTVSRGAFNERLGDGRFDVAALSLDTCPSVDAWSLLHSRAIETADNYGGFNDAKTDLILDAMRVEEDPSTRRMLARGLTERVRLLQPLTFIARPHAMALVRHGIRGVEVRDGWIEARRLYRPGGDR